jgi:ethanolamine transporter EutH
MAKAINLGNSTASTALVEYNKEIISKGKVINIAFTVVLSACLGCALGDGFGMQIIERF